MTDAQHYRHDSPQRKTHAWLMLAFPGAETGIFALRAFAPSRSGKCWYRRLGTREQAIACKRELVEAGIRYQCHKVEDNARSEPYEPRFGEFGVRVIEGGKSSRTQGLTAAPRHPRGRRGGVK